MPDQRRLSTGLATAVAHWPAPRDPGRLTFHRWLPSSTFALGRQCSPVRQRLLELSLGLWDHLASVADFDRDGAIIFDEYKKAFANGLLETEASFEQGYRPFLDAIMAVVDTDGNGMLDVDEYVRWTGALMRLPEADAREIHRRLDTDGDGFVTTPDLLQAIHDFYFDDNPDGIGSWLLGQLPD